jgi:hypothetical protein
LQKTSANGARALQLPHLLFCLWFSDVVVWVMEGRTYHIVQAAWMILDSGGGVLIRLMLMPG